MTNQEFSDIVKSIMEEIIRKTVVKGEEYSRNGNRFHNFIQGGNRYSITPEQYLLYLMSKHTISIEDMIADLSWNKTHPLSLWAEKITDSIIYLLLLYAMQIERNDVRQ